MRYPTLDEIRSHWRDLPSDCTMVRKHIDGYFLIWERREGKNVDGSTKVSTSMPTCDGVVVFVEDRGPLAPWKVL